MAPLFYLIFWFLYDKLSSWTFYSNLLEPWEFITNVWFYSVLIWVIETNNTLLTFLTVFCSLIWSERISMYGWRELLIHENMVQDRIEPKMRENAPNKSMIHNCWKAWFSMSIAPMDSSKSQCLRVTVKTKQKIGSRIEICRFFNKVFLLKDIIVIIMFKLGVNLNFTS